MTLRDSKAPASDLSQPLRARLLKAAGMAVTIAYVGTYVFLSAHGQYLDHNQGGQDNRRTWAPARCAEIYTSPVGRPKLRFTALGCFFLPTMLVDQWFIHRTEYER